VEVSIKGMVASTVINQIFTNNTEEPIEAVYIFPLPNNSAVYDMKMLIKDRLIQGEIKEREEAKRIYIEAKNEGKRAALTEQERPNIFTNSVANVMPNDTIIVQLQYVEKLQFEDGIFSLCFPIVIGPRYIHGNSILGYSGTGWAFDTDIVQDASRITPQVIPPGYRSGNNISIKVDLDSGLPIEEISSVSHELNIIKNENDNFTIDLKDEKVIPNKDFVLEYQMKDGKDPQAALFTSKKSKDNYFMLMVVPPSQAETTEQLSKEMIFVIDVSGSMAGTSINQAKRGLKYALSNLNEDDHFNIIQFESNYKIYRLQPLQATKENIAKALKYVGKLSANGGTEAKPALLQAMRQASNSEAVSTILFLTDGDVGNEDDIIRAVNNNLGNARLFSVAIGSAPNRHLLNKVSKFGRGTFTNIASLNEVESKMKLLFEKIEKPVLADVQLKIDNAELYPNPIPDLFTGQPMIVFGKLGKSNSDLAVLKGRNNSGIFTLKLPFDLDKAPVETAIPTLWAREKIGGLMDEFRLGNASVKPSIIELAIEHHLLTKFTSFVAVENKIVNPSGVTNLQKIPVDSPDGMVFEKVFGNSKSKSAVSAESTGALPQTGTSYPLMLMVGILMIFVSIGLLKHFQLNQK